MLLKRLRRIAGRDERGGAAMEFGLLLPFLMLVLLGTIDFGRFAYAAITISNAARTGAAACAYVTCSFSDAEIRQVVHDEAQPHLNIPMTAATIPVDRNVTSGPGCTTVARPCLSVGVNFDFSTLVPWPGIPNAITVRRTAQFVTAIQ